MKFFITFLAASASSVIAGTIPIECAANYHILVHYKDGSAKTIDDVTKRISLDYETGKFHDKVVEIENRTFHVGTGCASRLLDGNLVGYPAVMGDIDQNDDHISSWPSLDNKFLDLTHGVINPAQEENEKWRKHFWSIRCDWRDVAPTDCTQSQ